MLKITFNQTWANSLLVFSSFITLPTFSPSNVQTMSADHGIRTSKCVVVGTAQATAPQPLPSDHFPGLRKCEFLVQGRIHYFRRRRITMIMIIMITIITMRTTKNLRDLLWNLSIYDRFIVLRVWPDLAKFRHFGKKLKCLWQLLHGSFSIWLLLDHILAYFNAGG